MGTDEDFDEVLLKHYGIKGMRWGVRRDQATLDRLAGRRREKKAEKKAKKAPTEDARQKSESLKRAKKQGVQTLSNQELQALNNRLNLEQQYSNLTTPKGKNKKLSDGDKKIIASLISTLGPVLIKTAVKNKTGVQVGKALQPADIIDLRDKK